jgi:hypothetical protein
MNASKKRFDRLDANGNGVIDQDERQAARVSLLERFRSRREQRKGGVVAAPSRLRGAQPVGCAVTTPKPAIHGSIGR